MALRLVRPAVRHPWGWVLAVLAFVALLEPLLTPLAPSLAGWAGSHGHIYARGIPVQHAHPYDAPTVATADRGMAHSNHGTPAPLVHEAESTPDEPVVFVFDQDGVGQALAIPPAVALPLRTGDGMPTLLPEPVAHEFVTGTEPLPPRL